MPISYPFLGTAVFTFVIAGSASSVRTKCPPVAVTMCPRPTVSAVVRALCGSMDRGQTSIDSLTANPILTSNASDCGLTVSGRAIPATES